MESEDEVDIEGDFEILPSTSSEMLGDINEPPSKIALLQPDITSHPWSLEQDDWSLEHCTDERSRAIIGKMIMEEQQYCQPSSTISFFATKPSTHDKKPLKRTFRIWSKEEKQLFQRGLEIYGRKWKKISELIPDRSDEQVKQYGTKYFRKLKAEDILNQPEIEPKQIYYFQGTESLQEMETKIKTGETTFPVVKPRTRKASFTVTKKTGSHKLNTTNPVSQTSINKFPDAQVVRITSHAESDSEEIEIDIEDSDGDSDQELTITESKLFLRGQSTDASPLNMFSDIDKGNCSKMLTHGTKEQSQIKLEPTTHSGIDESQTDTKNSLANIEWNISEIQGETSQGKYSVKHLTKQCIQTEGKEEFIRRMLIESVTQNRKESITSSKTTESDIFFKDEHISAADSLNEDRLMEQLQDLNEDDLEKEQVIENEFATEEEGGDEDVQAAEDSSEGEHVNEYPIQGSDGKVFYLPMPEHELVIEKRNEVSDQEKEVFIEFFDGRPGLKAEDKYLEIRNGILDMWERSKPTFLNKTIIRNNLKRIRCDVNLLGRVHAYLEQIGAVNFGCEQVQYKNKRRRGRRIGSHINRSGIIIQLNKYKKEELIKRRRKVRDVFGIWVDEKEVEGRTIDHEKNQVSESKDSSKVQRNKKPISNSGYDPFKLVPCQDFGSAFPAPFKVEIDILAMLLMDIHSHLSKAEVIGLLGGEYSAGVLKVKVAEPCDSLSTGMQCEMDPVSQTEAKERISSEGLKVVGWYHSHPTFEPNPSIRDIETQQNFQTWFAIGKNPFIGVIVSPYCHPCTALKSIIRSLIIANTPSINSNIGQPFQFNHKVVHCNRNIDEFLKTIKDLLQRNFQSKNKVELLYSMEYNFSVTYLEKLSVSLRSHFDAANLKDGKEQVLSSLTETVKDLYSNTQTLMNYGLTY